MITVVIPTAGIGSRLGSITDGFNKALVSIGKKPSISYIIDFYPKDTKFIIALGYKGENIKSFIELAYPNINAVFVHVDKYEGDGSGLGYTLKLCEPFIDSPFFFHANDTIITDKLSFKSFNTDTIFLSDLYIDTNSYVTASINNDNNSIKKLFPKTIKPVDNPLSYIGIAFIESYKDFKKKLRETDLGITESDYLINFCNISNLDFIKTESWYDIGDIDKYNIAIQELSTFDNLQKKDESIFFVDDKVIKYFKDDKIINDRIKRADVLKGLVPDIIGKRKNFYSYEYVPGFLMSDISNIELEIENFLQWSQNNLWKHVKIDDKKKKEFRDLCHNFYYEKTLIRVNEFYDKFDIQDKHYVINGFKQDTFSALIKKIDWNSLIDAYPSLFHGDFHFENIIKTDTGYTFLDWRQSFGGEIEYGDIYYDLAKLNHGLIISHSIIKDKLFNIEIKNDQYVTIDFHRKEKLIQAEKKFEEFLVKNKLSLDKVKILTYLIFINIATLHTYPYSLFLYFLGIHGLNKFFKNKDK